MNAIKLMSVFHGVPEIETGCVDLLSHFIADDDGLNVHAANELVEAGGILCIVWSEFLTSVLSEFWVQHVTFELELHCYIIPIYALCTIYAGIAGID